jgi:hypothetical protein
MATHVPTLVEKLSTSEMRSIGLVLLGMINLDPYQGEGASGGKMHGSATMGATQKSTCRLCVEHGKIKTPKRGRTRTNRERPRSTSPATDQGSPAIFDLEQNSTNARLAQAR